jgi:hypothetical protein
MKKTLFAFLAFGLAQSSFAVPVDFGFHASSTPYDRYMYPVKNVLGHINGEEAKFDRVRQLMHEGRRFRYSFVEPYIPSNPATTAARHAGDCKDKALWLCNQLNDPSVRFVIGKARRNSRISHAWVYWQQGSRLWILDCTNKSEPIPADRVSANEYIPYYSYAKDGTYRHKPTQLMLAGSVAGLKNSPVASKAKRI